MSKLWRAVCPVRQYEDKLEIQCNSYKKGHTHLVWYKSANPEDVKEQEMLSHIFTVGDLTEGEYVFFTRNEVDKSIKTKVQILCETNLEAVDRIEQYVDNNTQHHQDIIKKLREKLKKDPALRPFEILVPMFRALDAKNVNRLKACFQLITIAEYCENMRTLQMNLSNEAPVYITNKPRLRVSVGSMVTKLIVLKKMGDSFAYYEVVNVEDEQVFNLTFSDNSEYKIEAYVGDSLTGVYVHFSGNEITKQWMWEECDKYDTLITDAMEQPLDLPAAYAVFTDEEKKKILIERSKNPFDELVPRPVVSLERGAIKVELESSELLTAIGSKFSVVAKEPDRLFNNDYDRAEKVNGRVVSFSQAKHLLFDQGDFYFYVQDDNKKLVSKLGILSLEGSDYSDYIDNVRQLELYSYSKRLMPLIEFKAAAAVEFVQEALSVANNTPDVNTANVYKYLIEKMNGNKHLHYFNQVVNAIMEDRIGNSFYSQKFFPNGIKLDQALNKFVFPPKTNGYVLQVDKLNMNDQSVVTEYHESGLGAIEVQARGYDYYIFHAIDKTTYRRSGFVFVSTAKHTPALNSWNIDIEVM